MLKSRAKVYYVLTVVIQINLPRIIYFLVFRSLLIMFYNLLFNAYRIILKFIFFYLGFIPKYKDSIKIINYIVDILNYYKYELLKKIKFFILFKVNSIARFNNIQIRTNIKKFNKIFQFIKNAASILFVNYYQSTLYNIAKNKVNI